MEIAKKLYPLLITNGFVVVNNHSLRSGWLNGKQVIYFYCKSKGHTFEPLSLHGLANAIGLL